MAVFVITADLFRELPYTEYGSVLCPFINNTKDLSISIDNSDFVKELYLSVFNKCNPANRFFLNAWFDMLGKMNGQGGRYTIHGVSIDKKEKYDEETLFLEISSKTNSLTGMIVTNCQSLKSCVCNDMVKYNNKNIPIFSIIKAKNVINNSTNILLNASDQGIVKNNKITINNYCRND